MKKVTAYDFVPEMALGQMELGKAIADLIPDDIMEAAGEAHQLRRYRTRTGLIFAYPRLVEFAAIVLALRRAYGEE